MSKYSESITFVLFTFNEENRIERAILNFKEFGRILIVDNESVDRTRDIAAQHGCDILINRNAGWVEDEISTANVKAQVKTDWIYWGFADEMVEANTLDAIIAAIDSDTCDIVSVVRKNYYYGKFCNDLFADRMNRIFRKNAIDFTGNKIHEFGRVAPGARTVNLPSHHFVHHFISNTAKSYLQSMDRYTDLESAENRPMPGLFRLSLATLKLLVVNLVFRRGYRAGIQAYLLSGQMVYYRWLGAMKIYERQEHLDGKAIERRNDAVRDQILHSLR